MKDNYLSNITVLFIDDEDGIRDSFKILLQMWCKEAYAASDGDMGYEMYKAHKPDIIITDIRMPKSTGLDMIKKIRETNEELPILITTAFENSEYLLEAIKLKVTGYLIKPISKKDLKSQLTTLAKNISNEKEIELINSKNKLYLDMACGLMIALDKDGNVEMLNSKGCELLDTKQEDVIGKNWFELGFLPPEIVKDVKEYFFKLVNEEVLLDEKRYENDLISKNGKRLTLNWQNIILKDKDGNVTGTFSSAMDITELRNLEEQKLEHQKIILTQSKVAAIGEMLGNIAHQWRQPLSIISTHVSAMQADIDFENELTPEKINACANGVLQQTAHLSKTIDDFRDFYRSDTSIMQTFNIQNTIYKLKALVIDSFKNNYINCILNLKDYEFVQNENLLIQAMLNICNNAKDALKENTPEINRYFFIDINIDEKSIYISFKDSGGGIDEDIIDNVFDPYFTTKHKFVGTGIGLYMTHQIITKHFNGEIQVSNTDYEYEGKKLRGAEFVITLPLS